MFVEMLKLILVVFNYIFIKRLWCRHYVEMSKTDNFCLKCYIICLLKSKKNVMLFFIDKLIKNSYNISVLFYFLLFL